MSTPKLTPGMSAGMGPTHRPRGRLRSWVGVWLRATAALAVMLALAGGVPWLLVATVGNPLPAVAWSWSQPLTDEALLGLVAALAWLFWAQMTACLVVEIVAELRVAAGRSAHWMTQIPGTFGGQQHLARVLVQAVIAVGIGAGVAATPAAADVAVATPDRTEPRATQPPPTVSPHGPARTDPARHAHPLSTPEGDQRRTLSVEVVKGDTLWSIAERHLGSGEQWRRIAEANEGRLMPDGERFTQAGSIRPGWQLYVPASSAHTTATRPGDVVVEPGDTLWGLAEAAYGDGKQWPRLYEANRDRITDPDLIHPGQVLAVPGHDVPVVDPGAKAQRRRDAADPATPAGRGLPEESPPDPAATDTAVAPDGPDGLGHATAPPPPGHTPQASTADTVDTIDGDRLDDGHPGGEGSLAAALAGGGALLAGGALAMLLAHRRRQFRNRRSGRTIASTPPHLVPAEATLRATGSAGGDSARFLDRALRDLASRLADTAGALPDVAAVRLAEDRLDLLLAAPPDRPPPGPWIDDTTANGSEGGPETWPHGRWALARGVPLEDCDALAPYPVLVAIGTAGDGATWLLDLEAAGLLHLTGDRAACEDLARFMAAELAVNAWSDDVDVTLAGFADELVGLNPARLRYVDQADVDGLTKTARRVHEAAHTMGCDVLGGRLDGAGGDTWMPTVLLTDADTEAGSLRDDLDRLLDELALGPGRAAVAAVTVAGTAGGLAGPTLTLDGEGNLDLAPWGVRLRANRLTGSDAQTLARLLTAHDDTGDTGDEPMPAAAGRQPYQEVCDVAGAIRVELTAPRDSNGDPDVDPADVDADVDADGGGGVDPDGDGGTLLPRPDEQYLTAAATTPADLAALAPNIPAQTRSRAVMHDPGLDEDLTAWSDPDTARPRLRLLGPVELRATGERKPDVDRRCGYYTELVAYLATRDHGATPAQVAEVFGVQPNTLHSRVGILRRWLGADPVTGGWYLPESTLSPAGKARGVPVYEVVGLVCDADLFKRLRVRGQARGPAGMGDLIAALRLVEGAPFDQLRPCGYGWLADTPLDQYLTAGVVDVAHIVATHALAEGDADLALWASERAIAAAPFEDKPRLDLARALTALGRTDEAEEYVAGQIHNRSDDGAPPPAPSARTTEVLEAHSGVGNRVGDPRHD